MTRAERRIRAAIGRFLAAILSISLYAVSPKLFAEDEGAPTQSDWSVHGQSTLVSQEHGSFDAPYSGVNSLADRREIRSSLTATLFLGTHIAQNTEIYFDPEAAMGRGFSGVTGIAGFPNGEISRVSSANLTFYDARLFVRQTINLGGANKLLADDTNQIGETVDANRLVVTVGKFSAIDMFDANQYSHDPRAQFLNWALMANGAWDFPADARGYTTGIVAEWIHPEWSLRGGYMSMPVVANGLALDSRLSKVHGVVAELERDFTFLARPGVVRALVYRNRADMGSYEESVATAITPLAPDITSTRALRDKTGLGVNAEQEISDSLGAFLRAGFDDGRNESFVFTEIDRTLSGGVSIKGAQWGRSDDVVGVAGVVNGLSQAHRGYLAAGGLGFIIGDGRLNYGTENIIETYYALRASAALTLSFDAQHVDHPAYNRDRGPVNIWSTRLHAEF